MKKTHEVKEPKNLGVEQMPSVQANPGVSPEAAEVASGLQLGLSLETAVIRARADTFHRTANM